MERTIEQQLAAGDRALSWTVGVSMEPLLHARKSTVVLEPPNGPLKRGAGVLYRRPAGAYVLHRIVKVLDGAYRIRGDNCYRSEKVPAGWVIGVMTGFYQDERDTYTSCDSPAYRKYVKTVPLRYTALWLRAFPGRVYRKLQRIVNRKRGEGI